MTQRLDEYDYDEWFAIGKRLKPGLTEEEFRVMWDDFQEMKRQRSLQ